VPLPFSRNSAAARPTFSRDFAGVKTLDHGVGPAITFTRADATTCATFFDANGVLQLAAANVPRFDHDPATAGNPSRGLLIEEARTNLLVRSAEFTDASWAKTNVTASDGQAAPDGTTNADGIFETATTGIHETRQSVSIAATATHTYSVFLKANGRNFATVYVRETANSGATYVSVVVDLSNGSISGSPVGTATVTSVGNGWYRVAVSASIDAGTRFAQIRLREDASTTSYAGDITKGILAWGAQLEAGAFPTSYIPTTSAAATRAADSAAVTSISSFYNQAEGTLFAEASVYARKNPGAQDVYSFAIAQTNRIGIRYVNANISAGIAVADTSTFGFGVTGSVNIVYKTALAYAVDNSAASINGSDATTDTDVILPSILTGMFIGRRSGTATDFLNGHIRRIAYWPRRLSNSLLQQLTV
jgi:hypothetical protein